MVARRHGMRAVGGREHFRSLCLEDSRLKWRLMVGVAAKKNAKGCVRKWWSAGQEQEGAMECVTPLNGDETRTAQKSAAADGYLLRVLVALDMAANVALGGREDETISANTAMMARKHQFLGSVMSRMLDLFQADHGAKAAAGDLERAEAAAAALRGSGLVMEER